MDYKYDYKEIIKRELKDAKWGKATADHEIRSLKVALEKAKVNKKTYNETIARLNEKRERLDERVELVIDAFDSVTPVITTISLEGKDLDEALAEIYRQILVFVVQGQQSELPELYYATRDIPSFVSFSGLINPLWIARVTDYKPGEIKHFWSGLNFRGIQGDDFVEKIFAIRK